MPKRFHLMVILGVLSVGLVVALVAGCGSSSSSSASSSSTPTEELHIYAWSGEIPASTVSAFEKATGIKTTVDTFDSNETMVSKLQAGASGYDLVEPSQYAVQELAQLNLIAPLDKSRLSNFKNLMPMFQDPVYDRGDKYSIPWIWGTTGLAYNDKYVKGPVTSWKALWNPAYKGHILMLDNMLAAYIAAFQVNGYNFNTTDKTQIAKATQSLMQQRSLLMGYNATNFAQLLSQGQCWICEAWNSNITPVAASNKHIHYVLPSEGGSFWTDGFVLLKSAKNTDAAYQWLNFVLDAKVAAAASNGADFAVANEAAMPYIKASIRNDPTIYTPLSELKRATVFLNPTAQTALLQGDWTKLRAQ